MADYPETYPLTAFVASGGVVAADRLEQEIHDEQNITIDLSSGLITTDATNCYINFKEQLPSGQKTPYLDDIVAAHSGLPLEPAPTVSPVMLEPTGDPTKKLQIVSYEFEANLNGDTTKLVEFSEDRDIQGADIQVINHQHGPNGDTFRLGIAANIGGQWVEMRTLACAHDGDDLSIPPSGMVSVITEGTASMPAALRIAIKYTSTATAGDKPLINMLLRTWTA